MADKKLTEQHKRVLLQQVAAFNISPTYLSGLLGDSEVAEKLGFPVIHITPQRVGTIVREFTAAEVVDERKKFLADFSDMPLAHKKMRVKELIMMYEGEGTSPTMKQSILRDIKAEIGEDIDKLADALSHSNGDTYNITNVISEAQSAKPSDRETLVKNAIAGFGGFTG